MDIVDVLKGLKKDGKILINTRKNSKDFDFSKEFSVSTVDATGIALTNEILVGGIPVVNTPILGAVPKILDRVTLKAIKETVKEKWKGDLSNKNMNAAQDAFDIVEVNK
jgi:pyruvate ferredoxin oxidoreductase gamma subunit